MKQFPVAIVTTLMMASSKVVIPAHLHMEIKNTSFVPKIKDMDMGVSNLTQLAHVGLQCDIGVQTKISNDFETMNFCLDFRVDKDEYEKYETWVFSTA